jgi:Icc protein
MALRIAVVTDIHHGRDAEAKKGTQALPLMAEFARFVADARPDLVLDLGDRISDEDPEADVRLQKEVAQAFLPIAEIAPIHHVCGNHDRDFLSVRQNEEILGQQLSHRTIDAGGWRIALFRADTLIRRPGGFQCPPDDVAWLAATAASADRPLLVASHVPMSGHSQIGNYYFQRTPSASTYPSQGEALRQALHTAPGPIACVAGHVHWNTVTTVNGVPHFTQQSLTESFVMSPRNGEGEACGAFGLIELSHETIDWRVFGADAFRVSVPVAQTARRWYSPLPPLEDIAVESEREARIAAFHASRSAAE